MTLHCCYSSQTLQVCSHRGWRGALVHPGRSTSAARGSRRRCAWGGRQTGTPASQRGPSPHSNGSARTERGRVFVSPGHCPAHVRTLLGHWAQIYGRDSCSACLWQSAVWWKNSRGSVSELSLRLKADAIPFLIQQLQGGLEIPSLQSI